MKTYRISENLYIILSSMTQIKNMQLSQITNCKLKSVIILATTKLL